MGNVQVEVESIEEDFNGPGTSSRASDRAYMDNSEGSKALDSGLSDNEWQSGEFRSDIDEQDMDEADIDEGDTNKGHVEKDGYGNFPTFSMPKRQNINGN